MSTPHDLVIRAASIADGLGSALFQADIAIDGDTIAAIGPNLKAGRQEIDAAGLLVTPGFVDIHTHYDGQAMWDSTLASSSWHGVTTVVMGNCGVGFAPVRKEDRDCLIALMEGVEDIPGAALHEGLDWSWESFSEYLDAVDRLPHDVDICAQLPHGPLRVYVMGERALRLEPANEDDIRKMRSLACDAMKAGALGFSTSRSINHRSVTGDPTPSLRAAEQELQGIALGLRDAGHGVLSLLSDFDTPDLESEFAMLRRVVASSGRPLSFSLLQKHRPEQQHDWKRLLELTQEAVDAGLPMRCQVAPRPVGTLLGIQATRTPFSACPTFLRDAPQGFSERLQWLRQPDVRSALIEEAQALPSGKIIPFHLIFPLSSPPNYEPAPESSMEAQAKRNGRNVYEWTYDRMLDDDGRAFLYAPFANYAEQSLDACANMLGDPNTVVGLGDGGAHVGLISDASFPTYLLQHWGRDRSHGRFDISWLVKRQTSDTARAVGLLDRGVLAPGMKADINIIDIDSLTLESPSMHFDLPAGGKRLLQSAQGYKATVKSGQITYQNGRFTGKLPGKLIRGPQARPSQSD